MTVDPDAVRAAAARHAVVVACEAVIAGYDATGLVDRDRRDALRATLEDLDRLDPA